ncbi:MAG: hypothetical protein V1875_02110 [Candidatus Altiarchaeota archaeon]
MKKEEIGGYVMAGAGFFMLLLNAANYVFGWGMRSPAYTVLGLVFAVVGMKKVRGSGKNPPAYA